MMTKHKKEEVDLDAIVDELDPDKINEKVELPHKEARNKFKSEDVKANNYTDFKKKITEYVKHHHKEVYGADMPDEMAFSKAQSMLHSAYEKKGGFVAAFKDAKKGNLNDIFNVLSDTMEGEHRESYVNNVMSSIDPMDFDTHVKLVKQYQSKYKDLLPKDMKKKSPEELAKDYKGLIHAHVNIVDSARSIHKKYKPEGEEENKAA